MSGQDILVAQPQQRIFEDPRLLFVPAACGALSLLLFSTHALVGSRVRRLYERLLGRDSSDDDMDSPLARTAAHDGGGIVTWKMLRLISCLSLFGLSALLTFGVVKIDDRGYRTDEPPDTSPDRFDRWTGISLATFYAYTTVLASIALFSKSRLRTIANFHLVVLLLATFSIYFWRDIIPLTVFPLRPADNGGGWFTLSQFTTLTFAAVIIPLFIPRPYIPLDPTNPGTPTPEQTTPLISLVSFSFLDSIVWSAYRTGHFAYDQLPPLADVDRATYLKARSFEHLDPLRTGERHLFWGLMRVLWREYTVMAGALSVKALMEFAGPVSIRFLLEYLENKPETTPVRPWVWIIWLFLGQVLGSFAMQWYTFLSSTLSIRVQGMLTQLLFEHSLRIRLVAETRSDSPAANAQTPSEEAPAQADHGEEPSTSHTLVESSAESDATRIPDADVEAPKANSNLTGRINNLMSEDLTHITDGRDFLFVVLFAPIQLVVSAVFLYNTLGWSALVGMAVQIMALPIPGKVATLTNRYQIQKMQSTDARVQTVTETMSVIRMIKLFGWERKVKEQIEEKRREELKWYRKRQFLELIGMNLHFGLPIIITTVTFASHTLLFKKPLTASMVFSTIGIFDVLRQWLHLQLYEIVAATQAKVSLDRMTEFLYKTDLLDKYSDQLNQVDDIHTIPARSITGFRNAVFAWSPQPNAQRNFKLRVENELIFHPGKINMITGPTGCGKTSMLLALLGEMHFIPSGPDSWFGLANEGGVAYAAQEAWIQNETIRENILFGAAFEEERYDQVIEQCALQRDLNLFEAGDKTEVGERGVTLSGGQKARVSLARALYSKASVILLDDILSALDIHTSRWIIDRCFRGDLIANRTVLIVTHNITMVGEVAEFVVSLGPDGRIASQGTVQDALRLNPTLRQEVEAEKEMEEKVMRVVDEDKSAAEQKEKNQPDGKLVVTEEVAQGHISWAALKMFLFSLGGVGFWTAYGLGSVLWDLAMVLQTYWLSVWARAYNRHPDHPEDVDVMYYLAVYGAACVIGLAVYNATFSIHILATVRSSQVVHAHLASSILGAPLRWIDSTPVGRVIARFTQDISALDGPIPSVFQDWTDLTIQLASRLAAILIVSPLFTVPAGLVTSTAVWIGRVYIAAQLPIKREMSNTRAPLFSHFEAALHGIVSIRAYAAEEKFKGEAATRIDRYTRPARMFNNLNRWIAIRMDVLGGVFLAGLATYLVYLRSSADASTTGFSLTVAITFSSLILWWVRMLNWFELQGNSLERIQHYIDIEQEPNFSRDKVPPAYWPASGKLVVEGLSARYSRDGPPILHDISFAINSGEHVGVVGRTGSGKSSLALSLLRMIPIEGNVYFDGIPTHAVNLGALRSNMTIIPQQPELMSGTVRQNLDPFGESDDATLNAALRSAGLGVIQSKGSDAYINLDTSVAAGGKNLSVGQCQILSLARAITRRSKVLILDEATAAIDYKTDSAIQNSIRNELKDITLIIIAHRLQTVCDAGKILVLDAGRIVEFDTPGALLRKDQGVFKSMVDKSDDRDALYAMAKAN